MYLAEHSTDEFTLCLRILRANSDTAGENRQFLHLVDLHELGIGTQAIAKPDEVLSLAVTAADHMSMNQIRLATIGRRPNAHRPRFGKWLGAALRLKAQLIEGIPGNEKRARWIRYQ